MHALALADLSEGRNRRQNHKINSTDKALFDDAFLRRLCILLLLSTRTRHDG